MKNKLLKMNSKILKIITMVMLILSLNINCVKAYSAGSPESVTAQPVDLGFFETLGSTVIGVLSGIGVALSVIVLVIVGIKYMVSSVEEKASFKIAVWPYLIGAFIVFGASTILGILHGIAQSI